MNSRGAVVVVVLLSLTATAIMLLMITELGVAANTRAQAQTAADAAALAAAGADDVAARDVAARNGAEVLGIWRASSQVTVEVRIGRITARATAERSFEICRPGRPCERLFTS